METFWLKTGPDTLTAADANSVEWLSRKKHMSYISAKTVEPRHGKHHRKFFALLGKVFANQDTWPSEELLLDAIKIGAGLYTISNVILPNGTVAQSVKAGHINWATMDQAAFDKFYDKALDVIIRDFWPGITKTEIYAEVAEMMGMGASL